MDDKHNPQAYINLVKPYLYPNSRLAIIIENVIFVISIFLVFYPFIYLGIRKWKKHLLISWKQILASYFYSFLIYFIWFWIIFDELHKWLYYNYANSWWLTNAMTNVSVKIVPAMVLGWSLCVFYLIMATKQGKFTLKNFIVSLIVAIALFIGLTALSLYLLVLGLGYVANNL